MAAEGTRAAAVPGLVGRLCTDPGGSGVGGGKWEDAGSVRKAEPMESTNGSDVEC